MQVKPYGLSAEQIEALLRQAGINPTAQRIAIASHVLCTTDHPTAEAVKLWADQNFPKMSLATVYNTLRVLVDAGLIRELKLPSSESLHYDPNVRDHVHFVDEDTGEIIDLPADCIDLKTHLGPEYQIRGVDLLIRGTRANPIDPLHTPH